MTKLEVSVRKRANQLNALRSTGPRSLVGKAKASRNAMPHGLSTPLHRSARIDARVNRLAQQLAEPSAPSIEQIAAEQIALVYLDLQRVQTVQLDLWRRLLEGQVKVPVLPGASILDDPFIREMLDPVARSFIWNGPLSKSDLRLIQRIENFAIKETGRRPSIVDELVRLDRYERRARSRLAQAKEALLEIQLSQKTSSS
jgi:hypothetical protein